LARLSKPAKPAKKREADPADPQDVNIPPHAHKLHISASISQSPDHLHRSRVHSATMSGVTYWLQKQRKGELIELARDVGMTE